MITRRISWLSGIALLTLVAGCGEAEEPDELTLQAQQAISAMESADEEAIAACEGRTQECRAAGEAAADSRCGELENSCQTLAQQLTQVREQAVVCWERVATCKGERCQERTDICQQLRESVRAERQPVIDCGDHVQQCMLSAAGAGDSPMGEMCKEMRSACQAGVAATAARQVQMKAQQLSGASQQGGDLGGEQTQDRAPEQGQAQGQAQDPAQDQAQDQVQDQAQDQAQNQEQTQADEPVQAQIQDRSQAQGEDADGLQVRQQHCLEAVATCGDSAAGRHADPAQLREAGNACDLSACME